LARDNQVVVEKNEENVKTLDSKKEKEEHIFKKITQMDPRNKI